MILIVQSSSESVISLPAWLQYLRHFLIDCKTHEPVGGIPPNGLHFEACIPIQALISV